MSDIVERLREIGDGRTGLPAEAADEIELLRALTPRALQVLQDCRVAHIEAGDYESAVRVSDDIASFERIGRKYGWTFDLIEGVLSVLARHRDEQSRA